jgi:hypothetical protein
MKSNACALKTRDCAQLAGANVLVLPVPHLPDADETTTLLEMVAAKYPLLVGCEPEGFMNALRFLAFSRRSTKFSEYASLWWVSESDRWSKGQGYGRTNLKEFTAAAIVARVPFRGVDRWCDIEFGLALGSTSRPTAEWRKTLDAKRLPESAPPRVLPVRALGHNMLQQWRDDDDDGVRSSDVQVRQR